MNSPRIGPYLIKIRILVKFRGGFNLTMNFFHVPKMTKAYVYIWLFRKLRNFVFVEFGHLIYLLKFRPGWDRLLTLNFVIFSRILHGLYFKTVFDGKIHLYLQTKLALLTDQVYIEYYVYKVCQSILTIWDPRCTPKLQTRINGLIWKTQYFDRKFRTNQTF